MHVSPPAGRAPVRNRRWLGVVVALLAAVGCAEIALRALDLPARADPLALIALEPQVRAALTADPVTFWRLRADHGGNRLGVPGLAPDPDKTERHFRIAIVGGTVAAARDVDADDAFPQYLLRAAQAEAPGARVEVLCLAVPGFSSWQQLRLWQQLGPTFAPDLVVLHCGAVADFQPASLPDAALAREHASPSRWRLWRLLRSTRLPRPDPGPRAGPGEDGGAAGARRVPVPEFTANVQQLLAGAAATGAAVCAVVPALGAEQNRRHPAASEYRAALRAAAQAAGAVVVDAGQLVAAYEESILAPACPDYGTGHGLRDGVRLTPAAHALLAERLLTRVRAHPRFAALMTRPADAPPRVTHAEPGEVAALDRTAITVHGEGFAGAPGLRLWIGGRLADEVAVVDDHRLSAQVPVGCPPGRHALALGTVRGLATVEASGLVVVRPAALQAELRAAGGRVAVALDGTAPPGARVQVFASSAGRANPIDTPAGAWWLVTSDADERRSRAPFCFSTLPLPSFHATADAAGRWHAEGDFAPEANAANAVLQGVVWLPGDVGRAVATEVVVRVLPR